MVAGAAERQPGRQVGGRPAPRDRRRTRAPGRSGRPGGPAAGRCQVGDVGADVQQREDVAARSSRSCTARYRKPSPTVSTPSSRGGRQRATQPGPPISAEHAGAARRGSPPRRCADRARTAPARRHRPRRTRTRRRRPSRSCPAPGPAGREGNQRAEGGADRVEGAVHAEGAPERGRVGRRGDQRVARCGPQALAEPVSGDHRGDRGETGGRQQGDPAQRGDAVPADARPTSDARPGRPRTRRRSGPPR